MTSTQTNTGAFSQLVKIVVQIVGQLFKTSSSRDFERLKNFIAS